MSQSKSGFIFPLEPLSCPWSELDSYCLSGNLFLVDTSIDLKTVAQAVASDDNECIAQLLKEEKIWKPNTEEVSPETFCTFIIVQPFIFVGAPS
jgi:hypothetical protein